MRLSIVIPVYNESENIEALYRRTTAALEQVDPEFEVICVNDGSHDDSLEQLLRIREQDARWKVLDLSRNFGHQAAIWAGMHVASGDAIGVMDGDLQDPPEFFKALFDRLQEGYDVVYAVRRKRKESLLKKLAYWAYYRFLKHVMKTSIPLDSGDFALMRREVLNVMLRMKEKSLFLRGMRHWVGFRQCGLEYERDSRFGGEPKYNLRSLIRLAYNGIFSFSDLPIKFLGRLGYWTILFSMAYAAYTFYRKLEFGDVPKGYTTLIIVILFFGGVQLVSVRVLGEYVKRIYDETRDRPAFIVREFYA